VSSASGIYQSSLAQDSPSTDSTTSVAAGYTKLYPMELNFFARLANLWVAFNDASNGFHIKN
jgi:hypothetical protein